MALFQFQEGGTLMPIGAVHFAKIAPDAKVPVRASDLAVGYDVFAFCELDRDTREPIDSLERSVAIEPGGARLFGIGVIIALPEGYEIQVRPRSGLASKHDIELANAPGTVDPDYRGQVGILLRNRGHKPFEIEKGMRIAQLIFSRVEIPTFLEVANTSELPPTRRGEGGFGSTGLLGIGLGTPDYDRAQRKIDRWHMRSAFTVAEFSECVRGCQPDENGQFPRDSEGLFIGQTRRYGCIIARGLNIIATGYNCQAPGQPKCAEVGCLRDELGITSGHQMEKCRALHAEQMAICSLCESGTSIQGATMYVTARPCLVCARMIAGLKPAGLEALVVLAGEYETHGVEIVERAGIIVREVSLESSQRKGE